MRFSITSSTSTLGKKRRSKEVVKKLHVHQSSRLVPWQPQEGSCTCYSFYACYVTLYLFPLEILS